MGDVSIKVHQDLGVWSELLARQANDGHKVLQDLREEALVEIVVVDNATDSGKASIAFRQEYESGEIAVFVLTLRGFLQATKLVMDNYVEEVRETFRISGTEEE